MEGALKRKLRSFLSEQRVLQTQYLRLKEETEGQDLEAREDLAALHEFDQLVYSYNAIKSYYEASKSHWAFADRQPFDVFGDLIPKTEAKLNLGDLCDKHNGLQVLRRQLRDNAKEGGKLAHSMMSSSATPEDLQSHTGEIMKELSVIPVNEPIGNSLRAWSPSVPKKANVKSKATTISDKKNNVNEAINGKSPVVTKARQEVPAIEPIQKQISGSTPSVNNKGTATSKQKVLSDNSRSSLPIQPTKAPIVEANMNVHTPPTDEPHKISSNEPAFNINEMNKRVVNVPSQKSNGLTPSDNTAVHLNSRMSDESEQGLSGPPARKKQKIIPKNTGEVSFSSGTDQTRHRTIDSAVNLSPSTTSSSVLPVKPTENTTTKTIRTSSQNASSTGAARNVTPQPKQDIGSRSEKHTQMFQSSLSISPNDKGSKSTKEKSPQQSKSSGAKQVPRGPASDKGSFAQFPTWSKDYVRCIVKAAASQPLSPAIAIQTALQEKCKIKISIEEANMLRSHYGLMEATMGNYEYYIQTFHSVATQFSEKRSRYVTTPWSDIRIQFARATRLQLEDWDLKGRYSLFRLHCRVYGKQGEPSSNYRDEVEAFKKKFTYRRKSSFLKVPQAPPPAASAVKQPSLGNISSQPSEINSIWSPKVFKALVDGYCLIPPGTPNKALALVQYIRLKTHAQVELERVLEKCKSEEFLVEVRKSHPHENEASVSKFLAQASSVDGNSIAKTSQLDLDLKKMASQEQPDFYYKNKFKKDQLTDFWDFGKTKCIMSTVEYASSIPFDTKVPHFKAIRVNVLKYIKLRLLNEHKVHIPYETVKTRIVRMMELDMFDKSQCLLLNEIIHKQ